MNGVCKQLCPQIAHDSQGFQADAIVASNLVALSKEMELAEKDFDELLKSNGKDLRNKELMEQQEQQHLDEEDE